MQEGAGEWVCGGPVDVVGRWQRGHVQQEGVGRGGGSGGVAEGVVCTTKWVMQN